MNKRTADFMGMLQKLLPRIGQSATDIVFDTCDDEVETLSVRNWGVGVDCGAEVPVKSIVPNRTCRGYRVFYIKTHSGNRWNPPEDEDVTVSECVSANEALADVAALIAREIAEQVAMSTMPEY